jgi:predicted  nucleic acid-binding Zn-ribbon protein
MALTPEETKAKKIAKKQAQIATKLTQIAKYEGKKADALAKQSADNVLYASATDAKVLAKLHKALQLLQARIERLQGSIDRAESKRLQYAQELASLMGPF